MMKTAVLITGLKLVRRFHPGIARNIQQRKRTDNIRLNKGFRTGNRIIDMALGGKMNNAADIVFRKQLFNQRPVTDVALNKFIIGTLCTVAQIVRIAGISQLIEVNNLIFRIFLGKIRNKIGSDKAAPPVTKIDFMSFSIEFVIFQQSVKISFDHFFYHNIRFILVNQTIQFVALVVTVVSKHVFGKSLVQIRHKRKPERISYHQHRFLNRRFRILPDLKETIVKADDGLSFLSRKEIYAVTDVFVSAQPVQIRRVKPFQANHFLTQRFPRNSSDTVEGKRFGKFSKAT